MGCAQPLKKKKKKKTVKKAVKKKPYSQLYFEARKKYPKACRKCEGSGWLWDEDPKAPDLAFEACHRCLSEGKCPVCFEKLPPDFEDILENPCELRCKKCKWRDGDDEVLPILPEPEEE